MPDKFGPRGVVAVAIPDQNSNMQPEYEAMRPKGISNQMYRFNIGIHDKVPEAVLSTLTQVKGCWPDMVICGNSLEMRWWSVARQRQYREEIRAVIPDIPAVTATDACVAALKTVGAKRISIISPMSDDMAASVRDYYVAHGFDVALTIGLQAKTPNKIIGLGAEVIDDAFARAGAEDVDTILHVGGALGIVDMLDGLETKLGKTIVSSNAATYWYALRKMGVEDAMDRGGRLTRMALPVEFDDPSKIPVPGAPDVAS